MKGFVKRDNKIFTLARKLTSVKLFRKIRSKKNELIFKKFNKPLRNKQLLKWTAYLENPGMNELCNLYCYLILLSNLFLYYKIEIRLFTPLFLESII